MNTLNVLTLLVASLVPRSIASLLGVSKATTLSMPQEVVQNLQANIPSGVIKHGNGKSLANGFLWILLDHFSGKIWENNPYIGIANCRV